MRTTISGERVRASYNGGLIVARRSAGILGRWAEIFFGSVRAGLRPYRDTGIDIVASMGAVGRESSEFWGSNQAALALAMWSGGHRVRHFADRYNVPLHLIALGGDIDSRWMAAPPAHVHYHAMFAARQHEVALDLLQRLGAGDDRLAWLRTRLPLVTHAARSADPALASS
jgi:hypothetical protein